MEAGAKDIMRDTTKAKIKRTVVLLALPALLGVFETGFAAQNEPGQDAKAKDNMVYVCACLKTKSCSCMTEAKTPGPCSCGTGGGPPMKAVPKNSAWAKENRDALAH
jgi:hypothetical protein